MDVNIRVLPNNSILNNFLLLYSKQIKRVIRIFTFILFHSGFLFYYIPGLKKEMFRHNFATGAVLSHKRRGMGHEGNQELCRDDLNWKILKHFSWFLFSGSLNQEN